jgi:hypothetical protein
VIRLLIGLLVFAGLMVWAVRSIAGSRYPGLRAAETLALILPLFLLLFASTYYLMERASAASFTEPLTRTDALYFTVTVFSTVGGFKRSSQRLVFLGRTVAVAWLRRG